ncbi:MAG: ribosomal protein S18-alanine N-acetyltransferase [Candidatus Acidiferrales bacterium]
MIVRAMERHDVDAVIAIQAVSPEIAQWARGDYDLTDRVATCGWVAEGEKGIAGFLVVRQALDEIEILNMAVLPGFRRQGIGSKLFSVALENTYKQGAAKAYLEVRASNEPAIEFYKQYGFRILSLRAQYYANPREDALVLAFELKEI